MISWTPDQKEKAKREGMALVKVQIQTKYTDAPVNIRMAGAVSAEKADLLNLLIFTANDDPLLKDMLKVVGEKRRSW